MHIILFSQGIDCGKKAGKILFCIFFPLSVYLTRILSLEYCIATFDEKMSLSCNIAFSVDSKDSCETSKSP